MKYIIIENQYKKLMENLSIPLRRRLSFENLKDDLDWIISDEISPSEFDRAGEFIAEACDMLKNMIIENYENDSFIEVSPSENDQLYYYLVNTFEDYLVGIYFKA